MANVGYATLSVIPSMRGFQQNLQKGISGPAAAVGKQAGGKVRSGMLGSLKGIAGPMVALLGVATLKKAFSGAIAEATEARKIGALTSAALLSTGGAANVTAKQVEALAGALSMKAGIDDELIQSSANVLLTFTKVRNEAGKGNDIFNQGTAAALDMSVALGQDLKGATLQIGKALNDPIKGVTALSRAGVQFTEQQKDQIKTMVEAGDTLGAQKIILGEMQTQFGGAAKAAADPMDKLRVASGNLSELVGTALLPIVDTFATVMANNVIPAIVALPGFLQRNKKPILIVAGAITAFLLPSLILAGAASLKSAALQVKAFVMARVAAVKSVAIQVKTMLWGAAKFMIAAVRMAASWVVAMGPIGWAIAAVVGLVVLIVKNWDKIVSFTKRTWETVSNWIRVRVQFARDVAVAAFSFMRDKVIGAFTTLKIKAIEKAVALVMWVKGLPDRIKDALGNLGRLLLNAGRDVMQGLIDGVKEKVSGVGDAIKGAFDIKLPTLRLPWNQGDGPGAPGGGSAIDRARRAAQGLPVVMTSSYRSPSHNAAVGGSPTSYHLDRSNPASDWVGPTWALDALAARLRSWGGFRELLWRVPNHAPGDNPHVHYADAGGIFKGPGYVWMGAGQETFASGLHAEKVSGLPNPTPTNVRVYIGDKELTDIVRVEVDGQSRQMADAITYGRN